MVDVVPLHFNNTYAYCPSCGGRLGERVIKTGESARRVCDACEFIYFQNPKVAAGVILMHEERLLLVRRSIEPGYGKWVFPGGYVDLGEDVPAAAQREAWEEAGVRVAIDRLLGVYSYPERPVVVIVYAGRVTEGTPCAGDECSEMRLFAPEDVPWTELAFPSTQQALRDYLDSL